MDRNLHLPEEDLLVFALKGAAQFSPSMQLKINEHLDQCPECTSCVAEARRELGSSHDGAIPERVSLVGPGDILTERYRIVRYVASGGMGDVYQAEDICLSNSVVALKTLTIAGVGDERAIARLQREARVALKVSHPHACRVHHYDVHKFPHGGEVHFLTMEWVEGLTLREHLTVHGPLSMAQAQVLSWQVLDALAAAHSSGLLHRDLKSSNVMLRKSVHSTDELNAVVMDFGLAKPIVESGERLTTNNAAFLGSAHYASPEQVRGESLTPCSDLYSFGVVLFEALTGQLPFHGSGALETALMRLDVPAPLMPLTMGRGSRKWQRLVARCLERQVGSRFESAETLKRAVGDGQSRSSGPWDMMAAFVLGLTVGLVAALW